MVAGIQHRGWHGLESSLIGPSLRVVLTSKLAVVLARYCTVLYCVLHCTVLYCTVLQGLVTSLASLCLLSLPACRLSNTSLDPGNGTSVSRCNIV